MLGQMDVKTKIISKKFYLFFKDKNFYLYKYKKLANYIYNYY